MTYFNLPRNGLVLEYLGDGNALDTNDGTKATLTATSVPYADCPVGYQKKWGVFNGSTSKVTGPAQSYASGTVIARFNLNSFGTGVSLWTSNVNTDNSDQYFTCLVWPDGRFSLYKPSNDEFASSAAGLISVGKNYELIYRSNGTTISAKLNGVDVALSVATTTLWLNSPSGVNQFAIGCIPRGSQIYNMVNGYIGGVRVFSSFLSDLECLAYSHEFNRKLAGGSDFGAVIPAPKYHWDFLGDATDVANAVAASANNGTFTGTDAFGITKGVTYNGSSTKTDVASITGLTTFTWVHRFKTSQGTTGALFDATGPNYPTIYSYIGILTANRYRFQYDYTGSNGYAAVESTTSINDNAWHTVVVTGDGTTNGTKLYVDGTLEATDSSGKIATLNGATYQNAGFGYRRYSSNNWLAGSISDTIIFPGAFTADQVKYLTNMLSSGRYPYSFRRSLLSFAIDKAAFAWLGGLSGSTLLPVKGTSGTITGSPTKVRSGQNEGLLFASGQYSTADLPNVAYNEPVTIIVKFKPTTSSIYNHILWKQSTTSPYHGYGCWTNTSGKLAFRFTGDGGNEIEVNGTRVLSAGENCVLAIRKSASSAASGVSLFVNGVPDAPVVAYNTLSTGTANSTGYLNYRGGSYGDGANLGALVYTEALSNAEIAAISYSLYTS